MTPVVAHTTEKKSASDPPRDFGSARAKEETNSPCNHLDEYREEGTFPGRQRMPVLHQGHSTGTNREADFLRGQLGKYNRGGQHTIGSQLRSGSADALASRGVVLETRGKRHESRVHRHRTILLLQRNDILNIRAHWFAPLQAIGSSLRSDPR